MKSILLDIGFTILLATTIVWMQRQPVPPIPLSFQTREGHAVPTPDTAIILFWDTQVKASHRDIQLIQRFQQAHPNIETLFIHDNRQSETSLQDFLISLGVYTTPLYSTTWPEHVPMSILIHQGKRIDLHHSPHYSQLMEFFEVEF